MLGLGVPPKDPGHIETALLGSLENAMILGSLAAHEAISSLIVEASQKKTQKQHNHVLELHQQLPALRGFAASTSQARCS